MKALLEIDLSQIDVIGELTARIEQLEAHAQHQELQIRSLRRRIGFDTVDLDAEMVPHRLSPTREDAA